MCEKDMMPAFTMGAAFEHVLLRRMNRAPYNLKRVSPILFLGSVNIPT